MLGLLATPGNTAQARGEVIGRGLVALLFVIAGVLLMIMHFVRGERN